MVYKIFSNRYQNGILSVLIAFFLFGCNANKENHISREENQKKDIKVFWVYFNNYKMTKNDGCGSVFPVKRSVLKSKFSIELVLQSLFLGPTLEEKERGYSSYFSEKTKNVLRDVQIDSETSLLYIDLKDLRRIIPGVSSSCGSAEFLSQVDHTLKQFSDYDRVIFAINGDSKLFYQWINEPCDKHNDNCRFITVK